MEIMRKIAVSFHREERSIETGLCRREFDRAIAFGLPESNSVSIHIWDTIMWLKVFAHFRSTKGTHKKTTATRNIPNFDTRNTWTCHFSLLVHSEFQWNLFCVHGRRRTLPFPKSRKLRKSILYVIKKRRSLTFVRPSTYRRPHQMAMDALPLARPPYRSIASPTVAIQSKPINSPNFPTSNKN